MARAFVIFILAASILAVTGCGDSGGGGTQSNAPILTEIAPSSADVGASSRSIVAYGSNFQENPTIEWNGSALTTSCLDINLSPTSCGGAAALTATVPASDLAASGTAKVTVANQGGGASDALNFVIAQPPSETWVRTVAGVSDSNDIQWDAARGMLYVSITSTAPANANTIATIDPAAGKATSFVPVGNNPDLLSISSDGGYLWAGMDGSGSVQRLLLPGLSKDISFPVPPDRSNYPATAWRFRRRR